MRRDADDCRVVLEVEVAPDVPADDAFIECTGFLMDSSDPCSGVLWPGGAGATLSDGRYHREFPPVTTLFGHRLELELELSSDTSGVARLCRVAFGELVGPDQCGTWVCASAGSVRLSSADFDEIDGIHGEMDAVFPDGQSIQARF